MNREPVPAATFRTNQKSYLDYLDNNGGKITIVRNKPFNGKIEYEICAKKKTNAPTVKKPGE